MMGTRGCTWVSPNPVPWPHYTMRRRPSPAPMLYPVFPAGVALRVNVQMHPPPDRIIFFKNGCFQSSCSQISPTDNPPPIPPPTITTSYFASMIDSFLIAQNADFTVPVMNHHCFSPVRYRIPSGYKNHSNHSRMPVLLSEAMPTAPFAAVQPTAWPGTRPSRWVACLGPRASRWCHSSKDS